MAKNSLMKLRNEHFELESVSRHFVRITNNCINVKSKQQFIEGPEKITHYAI